MKRNIKVFCVFGLFLCSILCFSACNSKFGESPGGYSLNYSSFDLKTGENVRLELSGNNIIILQGIEWDSSDESVASVLNGFVTAVGEGKTIISAEYQGQIYECQINVEHIRTVSLNKTELFLAVGDVENITLNDGNISVSENVVWSSSDTAVATVNNGMIECVSPGKVIITAEFEGVEYCCEVKVNFSPSGAYYSKITVEEMDDAVFEFDLTLKSDHTYEYFRRKSQTVEGGMVNTGKWEFESEDTLLFTYGDGQMRMRVKTDGTLESVDKIPTGGMEAQLTFGKA